MTKNHQSLKAGKWCKNKCYCFLSRFLIFDDCHTLLIKLSWQVIFCHDEYEKICLFLHYVVIRDTFQEIAVTQWPHIFTETVTNTSQGNEGAHCGDGVHDTLQESSLLVGVDS